MAACVVVAAAAAEKTAFAVGAESNFRGYWIHVVIVVVRTAAAAF